MNAFLVFLALFLSSPVQASTAFPLGPDEELTPGSLCEDPDEFYYEEKVPHCKRAVSKSLKNDIIDMYDEELGFKVGEMDRKNFKIDHYIPLCMGGSNERDNLWPQHVSVYTETDPVEQESCEKMKEGKLRQRDAIELIKRAKAELSEAPVVLKYVNGL